MDSKPDYRVDLYPHIPFNTISTSSFDIAAGRMGSKESVVVWTFLVVNLVLAGESFLSNRVDWEFCFWDNWDLILGLWE